MPLFSVIIPWRARPELRRTLDQNLPLFERHGAEVVIVNCGGEPAELASIVADVPLSSLRVVRLPDAAFNKSLATNIGALCASGRMLMCLDADIVLRSDFFAQGRAVLERGRCFAAIRTVYESAPVANPRLEAFKRVVHTQELVFTDGRKARLQSQSGADGSRCGSGLLVLNKSDLIAVGGFNSALRGWGFEDADLQIRLQLTGGLSVRQVGKALHLTHGDDKRDEISNGGHHHAIARNMQHCFDSYRRGVFVGSHDQDEREWRDRLRLDVVRGHEETAPPP
jgi:glycosyltransferase involved in cell wall biosynthesis